MRSIKDDCFSPSCKVHPAAVQFGASASWAGRLSDAMPPSILPSRSPSLDLVAGDPVATLDGSPARRLGGRQRGRVEAHGKDHGQRPKFGIRPIRPLPLAAVEGSSAEGGGLTPRSPALRILVVDDNVDSADSMALLLSLDGHEVRTAFDGLSALTEAAEFQPKAVLLDIGLPGMDGYEVARRLRELPGLRDVLMIAVTGYGQQDDRAHSKAAGFDYHLVKPVDPEHLSQLLNGLTQV
jgi:CheY-like chemotaxis protein